MTRTRKLLGLGIAIAPVAALLPIPGVLGQTTPLTSSRPTFEVATIKFADPNAVPKNQALLVSPTRLSITSMTLYWLIYTAYCDGGFNTLMCGQYGLAWA